MSTIETKITKLIVERTPLRILNYVSRVLAAHARVINTRHLTETVSRLMQELPVNTEDTVTMYSTLLNNSKAALLSGNDPSFSIERAKTFLAVNKRVLDKLLCLNDIMGLQPMRGPVGVIFALKTSEAGFEIKSMPVEAYSRKLMASVAIEAMQDASSFHGTVLADAVEMAIAEEAAIEIANEMLTLLLKNANQYSQTGNGMLNINRASTAIAKDSRRGLANVIITSPEKIDSITNSPGFVPETIDVAGFNPILIYVGKTANHMKVYSSTLPAVADKTVVLYRGSNQSDTGFIFCPYVLAHSSGVSVHPQTFGPLLNLLTRYSFYSDRTSDENHTSRYVAVIQ